MTEEEVLSRIARELVTVRQLVSEIAGVFRRAESEVPEALRRFVNYMHDVHDISYMYQELGQAVPAWVLREIERCDDRYRQLVSEELRDGTLEKVRRKMAEDPENRWDHTRQLSYRRPT